MELPNDLAHCVRVNKGPKDMERAHRLRLLQRAIEGDDHGAMSRMARRVQATPQRWNNVLKGSSLGADLTDKIVERIPGVSSDWLRYGKREGLSGKMLEMLDKLEE